MALPGSSAEASPGRRQASPQRSRLPWAFCSPCWSSCHHRTLLYMCLHVVGPRLGSPSIPPSGWAPSWGSAQHQQDCCELRGQKPLAQGWEWSRWDVPGFFAKGWPQGSPSARRGPGVWAGRQAAA